MTWFTSTRERWLWALVAALLAAVHASAVLAGSLADVLGFDTLLGFAFGAGFMLAVAAVVGIALARGPWTEAWVVLAVVVVCAMIPVRSGITPIERTHLFEYGLLAVLLYEALAAMPCLTPFLRNPRRSGIPRVAGPQTSGSRSTRGNNR